MAWRENTSCARIRPTADASETGWAGSGSAAFQARARASAQVCGRTRTDSPTISGFTGNARPGAGNARPGAGNARPGSGTDSGPGSGADSGPGSGAASRPGSGAASGPADGPDSATAPSPGPAPMVAEYSPMGALFPGGCFGRAALSYGRCSSHVRRKGCWWRFSGRKLLG